MQPPTVPKVPSLRHYRESRVLTQAELAERAGVHRITVAKLETGAESARPSTIRKLAAALGIEPAALIKEPRR